MAEKAVRLSLSGGNLRALKWVHAQPNWFKIFSEETVDRVNAAVKNGAETDFEKNKRLKRVIEDIAVFSSIMLSRLEAEFSGDDQLKFRRIGHYINNSDPEDWNYQDVQRILEADSPQDEDATKKLADQ